MAHMMKMTRGAIGHMFKHYERVKDKDGEYIKFGNQDIDLERTYLNYNLAPRRKSQGKFLEKRCNEVYCMKRKDVNVACSWVVTAPKDLDPGRTQEFFQESYNFLEKRYGKENVISSYVHMDESSPHMHFAFVPVVYDEKKDKYKVSAFERVDRNELRAFHNDLQAHMDSRMGQGIEILNGATKGGNKTIEQLKGETELRFRLKLANQLREDMSKLYEDAKKEVEVLQKENSDLKAQLKQEREQRNHDKEKSKVNPIKQALARKQGGLDSRDFTR